MDNEKKQELLTAAFSYAKSVLEVTGNGSKASERAQIAAFTLAEELAGWYHGADGWLEWCLKATEQEILDEALRRSLVKVPCPWRKATPVAVGQRVVFADGVFKPLSNDEIDISGLAGIITKASRYLHVKLDKHLVDLDEWDNELVWSQDDLEATSRLAWTDSADDYTTFLQSITVEVCTECGQPEPLCECPCANCGNATHEHDASDSGCPGVMFPTDVEDHLRWLKDNGLDYHLDDDPSEIWSAGTGPQIARVITMHRKMWEHFSHAEIWAAAAKVWPPTP